MGKVISFPGSNGFNAADDHDDNGAAVITILKHLLDTEPNELLVISFSEDGEMDVCSNINQEARIVWAIEKLKHVILTPDGLT